jgi:hypothetical protein
MWFENEIVCSKNYQIALIWDTKIAIDTNYSKANEKRSQKSSAVSHTGGPSKNPKKLTLETAVSCLSWSGWVLTCKTASKNNCGCLALLSWIDRWRNQIRKKYGCKSPVELRFTYLYYGFDRID